MLEYPQSVSWGDVVTCKGELGPLGREVESKNKNGRESNTNGAN